MQYALLSQSRQMSWLRPFFGKPKNWVWQNPEMCPLLTFDLNVPTQTLWLVPPKNILTWMCPSKRNKIYCVVDLQNHANIEGICNEVGIRAIKKMRGALGRLALIGSFKIWLALASQQWSPGELLSVKMWNLPKTILPLFIYLHSLNFSVFCCLITLNEVLFCLFSHRLQ